MNKNENFIVDGVQLLRIIANKDKDKQSAENALDLFIGHFYPLINANVEIQAIKLGYNEKVAFEAIQCAFNKVWMYPSFDMRKAHSKNPEKAITIWLIRIATSQMHQFSRYGICAKIKDDEDLSIIENSEAFVDSFNIADLTIDRKIELVKAMDDKISILDEKQRIIYLTYKAYQKSGKKLPRTVLANLRKRLGLRQTTVRVYKKAACEALNDLELLKA